MEYLVLFPPFVPVPLPPLILALSFAMICAARWCPYGIGRFVLYSTRHVPLGRRRCDWIKSSVFKLPLR